MPGLLANLPISTGSEKEKFVFVKKAFQTHKQTNEEKRHTTKHWQ